MHPTLIWANLPRLSFIPLRYIIYIMDQMGCDKDGIISVLQAKAAIVRPGTKSRSDRFAMQHKANSPSAPTIIFSAVSHLKYFLDHAARFLVDEFPSLMIGHSGNELPTGGTMERFTARPLTVKAFMQDKTFKRYPSNQTNERFAELVLPLDATTAPAKDYFRLIDTMLRTAQYNMSTEDFTAGLQNVYRRYGTNTGKELNDAVSALRHTHIVRTQSPYKRQIGNISQAPPSGLDIRKPLSEDTDRLAKLRRQRAYLQDNLEYMYNSDSRDEATNSMEEDNRENPTEPPKNGGAQEEHKGV
jgi:hypothetical protein